MADAAGNGRTTGGHHAGGRIHGAPLVGRLVAAFLLLPALAFAAELRIPDLKAKSGQELRVPVVIDRTANLAGIKLVLQYDRELLAFREGARSDSTQSMMHIINDKNPGKLIVVMASARGIQGREMTLLLLTFAVRKGLAAGLTTTLEIPEAQLMGDDLKEIDSRTRPGTITILP